MANEQFNYVKPVFLTEEFRKAYGNAELPKMIQPIDVQPTLNQPQGVSSFSPASSYSPFLSNFYNNKKTGSFTPNQEYKNLSTNFGNLGAITTKYGESTRYEKFHPGIDIANKPGTPIPSFVPGVVTSVSAGHKHGEKGYGNTVIVTDAKGNKHRYSHLKQVYVAVGQPVRAGQELATMGDTGSTYSPSGKGTGTHLDYRIVDVYNKAVNPYAYLRKST